MLHKKGLKGLMVVLVLLLLVPTAAWAAEKQEVPQVTEMEYRFFLECFALDYLTAEDIAQASDEELREQLIAAVEGDLEDGEDDYSDLLEDSYYYWEEDTDGVDPYTVEELERFTVRLIADRVYEYVYEQLSEEGKAKLDRDNSTPQEIMAAYYKEGLQQDYSVVIEDEEQPWYILREKYRWYFAAEGLQDDYGLTEDLSGYTADELEKMYAWLSMEESIRREYGFTEDLSGYTLEELYQLDERLDYEKWLRENFGVTEDLSGYTIAELEKMYDQLYFEGAIREFGSTEDLSGYTVEELEALYEELQEEQDCTDWQAYEETYANRIEIQINGEEMYITENAEDSFAQYYTYVSDTAPVMKDDRVYIPFRAVFEALGAEVQYDAGSKTITAKRGSREVAFTVGQDSYSSNGVVVPTDAAAFVQDGRTFVPVRFASQALGVAVGWGADNRTVSLVDKAGLLKKYQGQFDVLEQYIKHWDFDDNAMALDGEQGFSLELRYPDEETGETVVLPVSFTIEQAGLAAAGTVNYDAAVKLDIDELLAMIQQEQPLDADTMKLIETFKQFRIEYILDLKQGRFYLRSDLLDLIQGEKDAWYCIAVEEYLTAEEYSQYQELIDQLGQQLDLQKLDLDRVVGKLFDGLDLTDAYGTSGTLDMLETLYQFCGDDQLTSTGGGYERISNSAEDGYAEKLLFVTRANQVVGVEYTMDTTADVGLTAHIQLKELDHEMTVTMDMGISDFIVIQYDGSWKYTVTEKLPAAQPQKGDAVYSLEKLLQDWQQATAWTALSDNTRSTVWLTEDDSQA